MSTPLKVNRWCDLKSLFERMEETFFRGTLDYIPAKQTTAVFIKS